MSTTSPPTTDNSDAFLMAVRQLVLSKLQGYSVQVFLFGSRAKGNARVTSDIDIGILPHEQLPPGILAELREALFESIIPVTVDIVDLSKTEASFKQRVLQEGIVWND
jgi:predicted nucleotidyltransferase